MARLTQGNEIRHGQEYNHTHHGLLQQNRDMKKVIRKLLVLLAKLKTENKELRKPWWKRIWKLH
jgi:hypothetical protein